MTTGRGVVCDVRGCGHDSAITVQRRTFTAQGGIVYVRVSYCWEHHAQARSFQRRVPQPA